MQHQRTVRLPILILIITITAGLSVLVARSPVHADESQPPVWDGTLRRIRVPILMYHYISELPPEADPTRINLTVSPAMFRAHLGYLAEQGYAGISFDDLESALTQGMTLPPRPIILTFDDGYIDHYREAFPALRESGFTATFFIITGKADAAEPGFLSWAQIREMAAAGMSMESHTKTHQDLRGRDRDFLIYELLGSLESLSVFTGREPHIVAYPVGHYDDTTLSVLEQLPVWRAVTTQSGAFQTTDNRLEMPRLRVSGDTGVSGLEVLLHSQ